MTAVSWQDPTAMRRESEAGATARWPASIAALVGLSLVAWFLSQRIGTGGLLPLETVRFKGELSYVSESDLRSAVAPYVRGSWLGADVTAMRQAVEDLPWVKGAAIRRVWPDALRITVTEHEPLAHWREAAVISAEGAVFRPAERPPDLPVLSGPEGKADRVLDAYRRIRERLGSAGLQLSALRLDQRRSWRAELAAGTAVVIGRDERNERVARLAAAWPGLDRDAAEAARVDLRYPNGFAVRWRADDGDSNEAPEGRIDES